MKLLGRRAECEALDRLLTDALAGRSRVIVLRGEAGVGKSALLGYLSRPPSTAGTSRRPWASSRRWSSPTADSTSSARPCSTISSAARPAARRARDGLRPQRRTRARPLPGRPRHADAVRRGRRAAAARVHRRRRPVARPRLRADPRLRRPPPARRAHRARVRRAHERRRRRPLRPARAAGPRLGDGDARALLLENVHGPLDAAVCDQIITESHGNPLALLELPRAWNTAELAGGFGLPGAPGGDGQDRGELRPPPAPAPGRHALLVLAAAAEPLGDPVLLHRAAGPSASRWRRPGRQWTPVCSTIGGRVEFAHPLVRSAAYRAATAADRHRVHQALADATDAETDPDRRAWHRARATPAPDADVAAELERSASRAQARGGLAAAAAFLERAVALTPDPAGRAARALAAAQAKSAAGDIEAARGAARGRRRRSSRRSRAGAASSGCAPSWRSTCGAAGMLRRCCLRAAQRFETLDARADVRDLSRRRSWPRSTRAAMRSAATSAMSPVRRSPLPSRQIRSRPRSSCWSGLRPASSKATPLPRRR